MGIIRFIEPLHTVGDLRAVGLGLLLVSFAALAHASRVLHLGHGADRYESQCEQRKYFAIYFHCFRMLKVS